MLTEDDKKEILNNLDELLINMKESIEVKEKAQLFDLYASRLLPAMAYQFQQNSEINDWVAWEDLAVEKTSYIVQLMILEREKYV